MVRKVDIGLQEERRRQILDAAVACFARSGFRGASMAEICQAAGMSAGHLCHYFPGKEAIVEALCARDLSSCLAVLTEAQSAPAFAEVLVERGAEEITAAIRSKSPTFIEIIAEAARNPRVADILNGFQREMEAMLAGVLRAAQAQGRLPAALDPEATAAEINLIVDGYFARCAANPDYDATGGRAHLRRLLARALRPEPSP